MNKKVLVLITGLLILALSLTGCRGNKQASPEVKEYTAQLKLATMTPASHTYNQGAKRFADLIKERTKGRITITLYPDGQLGKGERELLEATQQGSIDMYVGSTGPLGGFSPSMLILDIPFLFRSYNHVDKVLDGDIGRQLLNDLDQANLKGLAFWENGFRNLTNSKDPVKTPEDAKGLRIRTMENKVHIAAWKAAGLNPAPMAWGEVYGALQQKTIDGQENPLEILTSSKLYEVQKYLSLTQHIYSPAVIIISSRRWNEMPLADRELFVKTALDVAAYQRKLGRTHEEKALSDLEKQGMIITRDVDKSAWRDAMEPAFDEFAKQFGKEKINAIIQAK